MPDRRLGADLSFLARPEDLADWRLVLAYGAAHATGVLEALPGTVAELARHRELDPTSLRAVLTHLAAWEIVIADGDRYRLGPNAPTGDESAVLAHHAVLIRRWAGLLDLRVRDRTANRDEFEPKVIDTEKGLDLLAVSARAAAAPIADACLRDFPGARRILDLGGGHGVQSAEFARRGLSVTLQDQPPVIDIARRRGVLEAAGVELFAGDFFEQLPPGPFDLVVCGLITNMFDEPRNRALLDRLRTVLAPEGGTAIVTYLRGQDRVASAFGLQMLVCTDGGDTHSADDYRKWAIEAGYTPIRVTQLTDPPLSVVTAQR
ncbi:class I SAM-dependent methyltransferase [Nocardia grenadensis]